MDETEFHRVAREEGWSDRTQVAVLLRYVAAQEKTKSFSEFLASESEQL